MEASFPDKTPLEFKILQQVSLILNSISLYRKGAETSHPVIEKSITDFLTLFHEYLKNHETLLIEEKKGGLIIGNESYSPNTGSTQKLLKYFLKFQFGSIEFFPKVTKDEILKLFSSIFLIFDRLREPVQIKEEIKKLNFASIKVIQATYEKVSEKESVISKEKLNAQAKLKIEQAKELVNFLMGKGKSSEAKHKKMEKLLNNRIKFPTYFY